MFANPFEREIDQPVSTRDARATSGISAIERHSQYSEVKRVGALTSHMPASQVNLLFALLWLFGAVLSLDRLTTYSYQTIATNSFGHHSELALVDVVRAILAAIIGPPFSLICDLWGRKWGFILGLILYASGHIIMATSLNIPHYIGGVIMYETGANGLVISQWTIIADISSTRNRLLAFILPQTPFMVFGFISTSIYSSILPNWRWGIGMFAILAPATLLPLILVLDLNERRAVKRGWVPSKGSLFALEPASVSQTKDLEESSSATKLDQTLSKSPTPEGLESIPTTSYTLNSHSSSPHLSSPSTPRPPSQSRPRSFSSVIKQIAKRVDLAGLVLLTSSLCALLIPLTLTSASQNWSRTTIIPLAIGGVLLPAFLLWEIRFASHPIMPSGLLMSKSFLTGGLALALFWISYNITSDYLPTYLYVVKGTSSTAQQNVSVLYSFTNALASIPVALIARYCRRLKLFTVFGTVLLTLGFGLMLNINQNSTSLFDVVSSQIVIGIGGAFTVATIQTNVSVVVQHALVARSISSLNICSSVGNAVGAAVVGSMWRQLVPSKLGSSLSAEEQSQITEIFSSPLTWILDNPIGTDARTKVIEAYYEVLNIMMIVAISICSVTIVLACVMSNPKLNDTLSTNCDCQDQETLESSHHLYPCPCKGQSSASESSPSNLLGESFFNKLEQFFSKPQTSRSS